MQTQDGFTVETYERNATTSCLEVVHIGMWGRIGGGGEECAFYWLSIVYRFLGGNVCAWRVGVMLAKVNLLLEICIGFDLGGWFGWCYPCV